MKVSAAVFKIAFVEFDIPRFSPVLRLSGDKMGISGKDVGFFVIASGKVFLRSRAFPLTVILVKRKYQPEAFFFFGCEKCRLNTVQIIGQISDIDL